MGHYALIGKNLGHSFSQLWFDEMFTREKLIGHSYVLHEMSSLDGLRQWVAAEHIDGFNVTIPYKQAIISILDELTPEANSIGAINCVCVKNNRLIGHNTDALAFRETLDSLIDSHKNHRAIILGTGGAALAVGYALSQRNIEHIYVSRNPKSKAMTIGYDKIQAQRFNFNILVNATPVGMWPNVEDSPWPWPELMNENILVYDLIYNPSPTLLMQLATDHGAKTADGLAMLYRQAELSWQLWQQQ